MPLLTAEERIGTVIDGKYRLLRIVARGGMGVLFEGRHLWTNRKVAVKLLRAEDNPDSARAERFITEARTAASLGHPNVVDILDMGEDAAALYVVMEFLEGRSLEDLLSERQRLPVKETLEFMLPILGALAVAHDAQIVHRDLKPANMFLSVDATGQRVPKLLDFGVAKVSRDVRLTNDGVVVGTPHYMSPEQGSGDQVGPESDVWAAGVVLYRCLCGALPFPGRDAAAVRAQVKRGIPARLLDVDSTLPPRFCAAIERALNKDPKRRYQDMRAFARALLVSALADRIDVPETPDPAGLPDWQKWRGTAAGRARHAPEKTAIGSDTIESTPDFADGALTLSAAKNPSDTPAGSRRRVRAASLLALTAALPLAALVLARKLAPDEPSRMSSAARFDPEGSQVTRRLPNHVPPSASNHAVRESASKPSDIRVERQTPGAAAAGPNKTRSAVSSSKSRHETAPARVPAAKRAANSPTAEGPTPEEMLPAIRTEW